MKFFSSVKLQRYTILLILIFSLLATVANASVYSEIPKTVAKTEQNTKEIKFGYNLTNNLAQKQSLFFIEGIIKNNKIDHTSRYQYSEAKTEDKNIAIAHNNSILFRTNTIIPFLNHQYNENSYFFSGILYGRYFNFVDKIQYKNSSTDTLYTAGVGVSKSNIYTAGFSAGQRNTNQIIQGEYIKETIIRPSISYTNKMQHFVPRVIKTLLEKNSIFGFITTETSIKIEYALVSGHNTNIEQFYIGLEKKILKNLALAIFYDKENTKNKLLTNNANNIERFSTSLVLSL